MKINKQTQKIQVLGLVAAFAVLGVVPAYSLDYKGAKPNALIEAGKESILQIVEQTTLLADASPPPAKIIQKVQVMATGYSSSIGETDDTPFTTASNKQVRKGIIANNLLNFGTKVRLPEFFGDQILVVEDRMNRKKGFYHIDVWFPSKEQALEFGAKLTTMEILAD